jgi:hypothetical protein
MSIMLSFILFVAVVILYLRVKSIGDRLDILHTHLAKMSRELMEIKSTPERNQVVDKVSEPITISMNPGVALTIQDDEPRSAPPPPPLSIPRLEDLARVASESSTFTAAGKAETHRSNADWEMLIGGNLFAKLGALAIVISAGFALNYAFVNDLIGEGMRILLGFLGGTVMIAGAFQARKKDLLVLAQVLVAAGISILYLTVYAMSQFYRMVPDSVGIGLMLGVSALTVILALAFASQPVALMAAVGAWLTPLLIGSDAATAIPLLVYMLIVSLAMASLVWYKSDWIYVRLTPIIGVLLLTMVWYTDKDVEFLALEAIFVYLIWLLYLAYDVYHQVIDRTRSSNIDIIVSLLSGIYVVFVTYMLFGDETVLLRTAAVGAIAVAYGALSFSTHDRTSAIGGVPIVWSVLFAIFALWTVLGLEYMYYGVIMMCITGAVVFLAIERLNHLPGRFGYGVILMVTTLALLVMGNDSPEPDWLIVNTRTLAYIMVIALWLITGLKSTLIKVSSKALRDVAGIVAILLGFIWLNIELETGFDRSMPLVPGEWDPNRDNWIELTRSAAWLVYSLLLFAAGVIRSSPAARYASIVIFGFSILKIFFKDLSFLDTPYRIGSFLILGVILLLVSFVYQRYRDFIFGATASTNVHESETKSEDYRKLE